jgi:hypothetical protein
MAFGNIHIYRLAHIPHFELFTNTWIHHHYRSCFEVKRALYKSDLLRNIDTESHQNGFDFARSYRFRSRKIGRMKDFRCWNVHVSSTNSNITISHSMKSYTIHIPKEYRTSVSYAGTTPPPPSNQTPTQPRPSLVLGLHVFVPYLNPPDWPAVCICLLITYPRQSCI